MSDFSFSRAYRIRKKVEFDFVFKNANRVRGGVFSVFYCPNSHLTARLGMVVTKKAGSSVLRSRVKRTLREYFRTHRHEMKNFDVVVLVNKCVVVEGLNQACWDEFDRIHRRFLVKE